MGMARCGGRGAGLCRQVQLGGPRAHTGVDDAGGARAVRGELPVCVLAAEGEPEE